MSILKQAIEESVKELDNFKVIFDKNACTFNPATKDLMCPICGFTIEGTKEHIISSQQNLLSTLVEMVEEKKKNISGGYNGDIVEAFGYNNALNDVLAIIKEAKE